MRYLAMASELTFLRLEPEYGDLHQAVEKGDSKVGQVDERPAR